LFNNQERDNMENELDGGAVALPSQPPSPNNASASAVDVEKLAQALEPYLQRIVDAKWQSGKDSRIGKLMGKVDSFESQLAEFKKWTGQGKSEEEALLLMQLARSLPSAANPQAEPAAPAAPAGNQAAQTPSVDTELLSVLGLAATDPDVTALLAQGKTDAQSFIELAKAKKAKPAAPPNAATILPTGGGSAAPGEDLDTITAELNRLMAAPIKDFPKILELAKKHRALLTGK
jgi:murein L,D-transpeptidase YcbB/YkuD